MLKKKNALYNWRFDYRDWLCCQSFQGLADLLEILKLNLISYTFNHIILSSTSLVKETEVGDGSWWKFLTRRLFIQKLKGTS